MRRRSIGLIAAFVLVLTACGGDDASAPSTTAAPPTTADAPDVTEPAIPQLTLRVTDVPGSRGQLLVAVLLPSSADGAVGSVCVPIDGDPWSGDGVFSTFDPENPCGKDAPYGETITIEGTYEVTIGVVTPGESVPTLCARTAVTIAGPSELTIDAAELSSACTGF